MCVVIQRSSSSSSSTSNDDQWVEKNAKNSPPKEVSIKPKEESDNWMDFICNTSTEIEKKTNSKNKDLEDAKTRMENVYQHFLHLCLYLYLST